MENRRRIRLSVSGRVQGVGFRWSTREKARELSLVGWVRNELDGSVSLVAEGRSEDLEALQLWCASGPARARVSRVRVTREVSKSELPDPFDVKA